MILEKRDIWLPVLVLMVLGFLWEVLVRVMHIPIYILPGPLLVFKTLLTKFPLLLNHSLITLAEIGLGVALALVVSLILAVLIQSSQWLERALLPLLIASQTIPVFALAPLLILWFGYGLGSKVVMTAIIVFFPIVINTVRGLKAVDPDTWQLFYILGATPRQIFFKLRIPQSLPFVFAGIRIGVAVSVIGAVIGEWVGARQGLGFLMIHANAQLKIDLVFAAIVLLSIIGVGLYALFNLLERLIIPHGLKIEQ